MVQWTFIEALIFGIVATIVSISAMILIHWFEHGGKKNANMGRPKDSDK